MARVVVLALALLIVFATMASAEAGRKHAREHHLFKIRDDQVGERGAILISGDDNQYCDYTVRIRTSCESPRYTRDRVSIAFGDRDRNEVYAPRLDDPEEGTFERCSTDTFRMRGPCGYGICYLYLRREGRDGWIPESVQISDESYRRRRPVTFYYGAPIPDGVWYGFDNCYAGLPPVLLRHKQQQQQQKKQPSRSSDADVDAAGTLLAVAGTLPAVAGM